MYYLFRSECVDYEYHGGHNETIVFLHGWGGDKNSFANTIKLLQHNYNTLSITLPTTNDTISIWQLSDYAQAIIMLMQLHSIINPIIICHSFGFRVCTYLNAIGIKFKKIIITGGAGIKPHTKYLCNKSFSTTNRLAKIFIKTIKSLNFIKKFNENNRKLLLKNKKFKYLFSRVASLDYISLNYINRQTFKNIVNYNTVNLIFFNCHLLLFWGKKDKETPVNIAFFLKKHNKCSLFTSKKAHFAYIDENSYFNHTVMRFI